MLYTLSRNFNIQLTSSKCFTRRKNYSPTSFIIHRRLWVELWKVARQITNQAYLSSPTLFSSTVRKTFKELVKFSAWVEKWYYLFCWRWENGMPMLPQMSSTTPWRRRLSFFCYSFSVDFDDNFPSCWLELVRSWDEFGSQLKKANEHKPCLMLERLLLLFLFICMLQISFLTDNERRFNGIWPFPARRRRHLLVYELRSPWKQIKKIFRMGNFLEIAPPPYAGKLTDIR